MNNVAVATTTYYQDQDSIRFDLACRLMQKTVNASYLGVVIDGSPNPQIRARFVALRAHVSQQTDDGMAGSRRQAFHVANHLLANNDAITVWTEPEKFGIVQYIPLIIAPIQEGRAHIVIAGRTPASWDTYPEFQVQSEKTANAVYRHVTGIDADPMFGPVAFTQEVAPLFINCNPCFYGLDTGYIQHVAPLIAIACEYKVECINIDFKYPLEQREEEETTQSMSMITKRMWQMHSLIESYIALSKILRLPR